MPTRTRILAAGYPMHVTLRPTMALMIALDASPQTRPIAVLLGPEISPTESSRDGAAGSSGPDSSE